MPTVFGILDFPYKTKLFGKDALKYKTERAFISTYQMLGYLKNNELIILAPNKKPAAYEVKTDSQKIKSSDPQLTKEAISFYQSAYMLFQNKQMLNFE
jgi:hypothetical protein